MAIISLRSILGSPRVRSVRSVISVIKLCHVSTHTPPPSRNISTFQISIAHSHTFSTFHSSISNYQYYILTHVSAKVPTQIWRTGQEVILKFPLLTNIRWKFRSLEVCDRWQNFKHINICNEMCKKIDKTHNYIFTKFCKWQTFFCKYQALHICERQTKTIWRQNWYQLYKEIFYRLFVSDK